MKQNHKRAQLFQCHKNLYIKGSSHIVMIMMLGLQCAFYFLFSIFYLLLVLKFKTQDDKEEDIGSREHTVEVLKSFKL